MIGNAWEWVEDWFTQVRMNRRGLQQKPLVYVLYVLFYVEPLFYATYSMLIRMITN